MPSRRDYDRNYIRAIIDDERKLRVAKYVGEDRWQLMHNPRRSIGARDVYPFDLNLIMFLLTIIAVQDPQGDRDITITQEQYQYDIERRGGSNKKIKNKRYKKSKRR